MPGETVGKYLPIIIIIVIILLIVLRFPSKFSYTAPLFLRDQPFQHYD